jgi:class 3 adenylate cyclase/tetratricopeptide (TPR) repeat protein
MPFTGSSAAGARYLQYLPRLVVRWEGLDASSEPRHRTIDGTVVFADVSGFTALTERLAAAGKVGAEQITGLFNGAFTELLTVARLEGGDLISFGGDALLLLFDGDDHARRALSAAHEMLGALDDYQRQHSPVPLAMSVGVASGEITAIVAGSLQRELFLVGPTVDTMAELEGLADAGQIVASGATLDQVDPWCRGEIVGTGHLLAEPPDPSDVDLEDNETGSRTVDAIDPAAFVPPALREELNLSGAEGEHRRGAVAFLRAQGLSELLTSSGADAAAEALASLVDVAAARAEEHGVTLLSSDVDRGGAKLILTAGIPRAVPDPEERLLRTARRIIDEGIPLRLHVGVSTGDVFAGDLGATFRRSYTVMGDTVNLGARLAGQAGAGEMITLDPVLAASRTRFDVERRTPVTLKGKSEPVEPIAVGPIIGARGSIGGADLPLFGRDDELHVLTTALADARHGRGTVIDLSGPVGIGKTRLRDELRSAGSTRSIFVDCEEYEAATPYHPIRILLRHLADVAMSTGAEHAGIELVRMLSDAAPDLLPWAPLLAIPFDAEVSSTAEVTALDPTFRSAKLAETVVDLLAALVREPSLIGIDNAQWIDSASGELLDALARRVPELPIVLVVARRDESAPLWSDATDDAVARVVPTPLDEHCSRQLLMAVTGAQPPPPHVVDAVVARAAGNPLFVIELAAVGAGDELPPTLDRLFAARIDGLQSRDRRFLRYASVLGEQFELDLMVEAMSSVAAGIDDPEMFDRLADFLEVSPLGRVRFRQPLAREIAYAGLAFARRQEIHGLVADTIERRARHRAARHAGVLSAHFEAAGRFRQAWDYAVAGGRRAATSYAHREASVLFERALRVAEQCDPAPSAAEVAPVAEAWGDAANLIGDFATAELAYRRAADDATRSDLPRLTRKRAHVREREGEYDAAEELLAATLADVETDPAADGTPTDLIETLVAIAALRYRQGRPIEAAEASHRAIDADPEQRLPAAIAHAHQLLAITDQDASARERHGWRAVELYEQAGDRVGIGKALNNLGIEAYFDGRWHDAVELYRRSREASAQAGDVIITATLDNNLGEILSDQGRLDEAARLFEAAATTWRAARYRVGVALVESNLGRLAMRRGDTAAARPIIERAFRNFSDMGAAALVAETEARLVELDVVDGETDAAERRARRLLGDLEGLPDADVTRSMLHRLLGLIRAQRGDVQTALHELRLAVDIADAAGVSYEAALARIALGELGDDSELERGDDQLATLDAGRAFRIRSTPAR